MINKGAQKYWELVMDVAMKEQPELCRSVPPRSWTRGHGRPGLLPRSSAIPLHAVRRHLLPKGATSFHPSRALICHLRESEKNQTKYNSTALRICRRLHGSVPDKSGDKTKL
jgi:hypothetical protein